MILYLPVEVKNRELYSKILLAKFAAERGFCVILGKKNDLNRMVMKMPAGIYLGLGLPENYYSFYRELKRNGHLIVVCEEEGLITYTDDMYFDMRISSDTLALVDLLFSWGEDNRDLICSKESGVSSKIKVTGHPRFDLLKPEFLKVYEKEMADIDRTYRNYILVCTCFSSCNHFLPDINYLQSLIDKKVLRTKTAIANFKRYKQIKIRTLAAFLEAIPKMAQAYPSIDIIVRPHPAESKEIYKKLSEKHGNVFIESRYSVHPWILKADAMIHHYCATSIEAYAAGIPRFALRPEADPLSEKEIPFDCSYVCKSADSLVEALSCCVNKEAKNKYQIDPPRNYSEYVLNIGTDISADVMSRELEALSRSSLNGTSHCDGKNARQFKEFCADLYYSLRDFTSNRLRKEGGWAAYLSHKFDSMSVDEIRNVMAGLFDENQDIVCKKRGRKLVEISRNKA